MGVRRVKRGRILSTAPLVLLIVGVAPAGLAQPAPDSEAAAPPNAQSSPPSNTRRQVSARTGSVQKAPAASADTAAAPAAAPRNSAAGATGARVVPPKLIHFSEAAYPEEAQKLGLGADVAVKVRVEADGSVGSVEIAEPAGRGFDEAAVAAVKRFVFTPAQVEGKPRAVVILYRYQFEPAAVTVELAEGEAEVEVEQQTTTGDLGGQLLMESSDVPVAGATIQVRDAQGQMRERVSDAEGRWRVAGLPPGAYTVQVTAIQFEPLSLQEAVVLGELTELTYRLSSESDVEEVVIQGERPPREVTRRTLERREISRIPGTGGDAIRSIQSLPGVARPPGLAGLLIVRGSAPVDTNTFIDGALVPLIYHFGGLSSVVPTELLDKIDFYPGNFSTKYGRVMGGVVDVELTSPDTSCNGDFGTETDEDGCFHGMVQADLIDGRFLVRGPIGDDWTFAVAGRRSWIDAWLKPVLESTGAGVTTAPVYYDYQVIAETEPSSTSKFRLQFYGSDDALELLINNPSAQEPAFGGSLSFGTSFYRAQAVYENQLTTDWKLTTMVSAGSDVIDFSFGPLQFALNSQSIAFRSELGWQMASQFRLNAGLDFLTIPYEVHVRAPEPPRPGEAAPGPFSTRRVLDSEQEGTFFRPAWYAEGEWTPHPRLLLVPGLRVDFARDTGRADWSPRVNGRFTLFGLEDGERKTVLKGGAGYFYQPPQPQETDPIFGGSGLSSNRALHYSIGVEQELTEQIEVTVEGYLKELDQLVSRGPSLTGFVYNNEGSGRVIGAETLIKYKPDARFFGWLAYSLSRSTRRDSPDSEEYLIQFDQTHILTVLGSYRLGDGWEAGARFRVVSGNMTTPVQQFPNVPALYAADAGSYTPLQGAPFSERLPLFHQLDIRLEKNWQFRDWRMMGYLDVWNAYNHAAAEGMQYNFDFSRRAIQTGLPVIPSLGLRGEF